MTKDLPIPSSTQRQYGDVVYAKDVTEDEKRREVRDKARLEKECERLREELQEERLVVLITRV